MITKTKYHHVVTINNRGDYFKIHKDGTQITICNDGSEEYIDVDKADLLEIKTVIDNILNPKK